MGHVLGTGHGEPMPVIYFNKAVNHAHVRVHLLPVALNALEPTRSLQGVVDSSEVSDVVAGAAVLLLELSELLLMVFVVQVLLHGLQERAALELKRTVAHFILCLL